MEIPENFSNVRYVFSCAGVTEEMSFAHGVSGGIGASASDIALACHLAFVGAVPETPEGIYVGWSYLGTRVTKTTAGEPVTAEFNANMQGTAIGQSSIVSSALLVRKTTAEGGRKNRGRMYVPPCVLAEAVVSNAGFIDSGDLGTLSSKFDQFHSDLVLAEMIPCLFHSDPVDTPTTITGFVLQSQLATQRRRMR